MEVPGQPRVRNHAALWLTSLIISAAVVGLSYLLFATFEYESWFSPQLRRYLNDNELPVFGGGGLLLCVLIALILYRTRAFSQPAGPGAGWASGPESLHPAPRDLSTTGGASGPSSGAASRAGERWPTIAVVMKQGRRACIGDMIFTDRRFFFVCYLDKSFAKATAGKAVASQFGLLGALIQALATGRGKKREEQEIDRLRQELSALPLEDRVTRNSYSMSLGPQEISLFSSTTMGGTRFEARGEKYVLVQIDRSELPVIKQWCERQGVQTKGF